MIKKSKAFTAIYYVVVCILLLGCVTSFFIAPDRTSVSGTEERYRCVWQDGTESAESYASA